jgi:flagellar protein FliO/FliZ
MTQTLLTVAAFVVLLAMVPMAIKWLQSRGVATGAAGAAASRVLSAVAVGPQQRVVTVEVGPAHDRVCLVLGVTAQTISCLHTSAAGARAADDGSFDALTVARPGA